MSVKNSVSVNRYVDNVIAIRAALENMLEFVDSLPAPDENDELGNMHYGHTGSIELLRQRIAEASQATDRFWKQ